jgi:pimeloyl-ACP methyl ester carboxylesterase
MPAGGYPVILAGHGLGDDRFGMPSAIAIGLCQQGYAVVAFNAFGHGYGPEGTVRVQLADSQPQYPIGGRGIDVTGTGDIGPTDGAAIFSRQGSIFFRDSLRQTALDWSQMTRAIQRGMDLDGAGRSTLDPSRIYYFGQSLGGFYGALFLAIEPQVVSAVLNVGGDSTVRAGLLSPGQRDVLAQYLTLAGVPPDMVSLDPNIPLRYEAVRVNANPLLTAVQNQLELLRWIDAPAAPENYTPHFKGATLPGVPIKRVLYQYVVGDKTVPNPSNVGLVIAANSRETTSVFRIDRVKSRIPDAPDNPHPYLALGLLGSTQYAGLALLHQMQAGQWLSGSGETVPDVNSLARLLVGMDAFETAPPLVEALNF